MERWRKGERKGEREREEKRMEKEGQAEEEEKWSSSLLASSSRCSGFAARLSALCLHLHTAVPMFPCLRTERTTLWVRTL